MLVLNESNFEQEVIQESHKLVLVDFWAQWCAPCREIAPILEQVEAELGDKVKIGKVDIQHQVNLAKKWQVSAIPTLVVFKEGEAVDKFIGMHPRQFIVEHLQSIL